MKNHFKQNTHKIKINNRNTNDNCSQRTTRSPNSCDYEVLGSSFENYLIQKEKRKKKSEVFRD